MTRELIKVWVWTRIRTKRMRENDWVSDSWFDILKVENGNELHEICSYLY